MVKVSYIRRRNQVGDVLRWVPNARGLDISLEPPVTSWEQRSLNFALLDDYAHLDVRRLDIGATEFLRFTICQQIPLLTVQLLLPRCLDLQQLLPPAPALYLCIRTEIRPPVPGSHSTLSGVITISRILSFIVPPCHSRPSPPRARRPTRPDRLPRCRLSPDAHHVLDRPNLNPLPVPSLHFRRLRCLPTSAAQTRPPALAVPGFVVTRAPPQTPGPAFLLPPTYVM
ncbi:hypothetical protein AURDEDRAFT_175686 [Auricularia subglabra TFB-10046 SS5]|nr:hypothetical protein AURDEDRAFT_175686 [Auricularia subglabra TFB-10046 SS5]